MLHGEEERCVDELQKTREAYKQRLSEDNELRVRLETEQGRTRDASSALAALQLQCSPKAIDATCAQRTAKADATTLECRRRLDEAVRQVRGYKAKLDAQQLCPDSSNVQISWSPIMTPKPQLPDQRLPFFLNKAPHRPL